MKGTVLRSLAATAAVGAACFGWGLFETQLFTVRRFSVPVLPAGARPIKVLHLSDIHLVSRQHRKLDWLASLADERPDLIVNTGDNIASADALTPLLATFSAFDGVPGVFVFGSNDYRAPKFRVPVRYLVSSTGHNESAKPRDLPWRELRTGLERLGWVDLTHRRATLDVAGSRLAFRGTDDAHLQLDDYSLVEGPAEPADLNMGVTHAPYLRLLDAMTADGMDLILAGHTHGGQVCVPFYGALTTNCDLDTGRVKGLSSHTHAGHTAALEVSAGCGSSPFAPYRFACRPEATLLTLTARPDADMRHPT